MDRYPEAIHSIRNIWSQYVLHPWRTFGPVHTMMKAADLIGLEIDSNMKLKTAEDFLFAQMTDDIQKILMLVKRPPFGKQRGIRAQI